MPGRLTIRAHFAFAVAAAVIPAALIGVTLVGYDYYDRERSRLERDSTATARALGAAVDAELSGVKNALSALGTSPYLEADDLAAFHRQASAALKEQNFFNIVLIDPQGRQQVNTLRPFGTPLPMDAQPQLKRIIATGTPMITDLFLGPVAGKPLIAVGVPVRVEQAIPYSLNAGIQPERLASILNRQRLPKDWIATVYDGAGVIVAHTLDPERYVGQKGVPEVVDRIAEGAEGTFEATTLEGSRRLVVYSHAAVSNWTVTIGIPKETLVRHLWDSIARLAIATFVMLLTAIGLAIFVGRRVAD